MINYDHMFLLNSIDANIDDRSNVLNRSTTSRIGPGNRIANPLVFLLPVPAQLSDTRRLCAFKCHFRSSRYKTRFAPLSWLAKDQGTVIQIQIILATHCTYLHILVTLLYCCLSCVSYSPVSSYRLSDSDSPANALREETSKL